MDLSAFAIVAAVAFGVNLALGLAPRLRLPAIVLEIFAGIVIGPSVLGWVEVDEAISLFSRIGLAFLLLIAGLEVDFDKLRGRVLSLALISFAISFGIAIVAGLGLDAGGIVNDPLLIAIAFSATGLGIVIPILKDAREIETQFGQLVVAAASIAEVATIVLLSLFFAEESPGIGSTLLLLLLFFGVVAAIGVGIILAEHSRRIRGTLGRLQDTTAQIRVRGAFVLLAGFVVLAEELGLEAILGAFLAGAIIKLFDRDVMMTHPLLRTKLEAAGFGIFIPFFFVTSGLRFDGAALFESASNLARVPIFLAILLAARGLPALLYRPITDSRRVVAAGLLQATSLSFFVVVAMIGLELGVISPANGAALIAAGLLSVLIFPVTALSLLKRAEKKTESVAAPAVAGAGSD